METDAEARNAVKRAFMTQLRRHRLAAGIELEDFASRLDVSKSAVSQWELGVCMPKVGRMKKIARILGVRPLELTRMIDPEDDRPGTGAK
jgi:transcriptional regulator with XRE-family HTH domain